MNKEVKKPKVLYHYCSVEAFYSIIKNHSIWLSDLRKTNDEKELIWVKGIVEQEVLPYIRGKLVTCVGDESRGWSVADFLVRDADLGISCWGFCLTGKDDNLGQWRGYGDDGAGVSIGFKCDELETLILARAARPARYRKDVYLSKPELTLVKVKYKKETKILNMILHEARRFLRENQDFCKYLEKQLKNAGFHGIQISLEVAEKVVMEWIAMRMGPIYKMRAFKEEKEWRIIFTMPRNKLTEDNLEKYRWPYGMKFKEFKFNEESLVSHLDIEFVDMKDVIKSITIGPKSKLTEQDIELILRWNGVYSDSIEIKKSKASYR